MPTGMIPMMTKYVYDTSKFTDDELISELEKRGYIVKESDEHERV